MDTICLFRRSVGQFVIVVVKRPAETAAQVDGREITGVARRRVVVADVLFVPDDTDGIIAFQSGSNAVVQAEHPLRFSRNSRQCYTY